MKKKIFYIILLTIISFVIFNYKVINNYINISIGNHFYKKEDFKKAIVYHNKLSDNFKNYNLGNDFYKLEDYEKAIFYYSKESIERSKEKSHNLGNSFFKLGGLKTTKDDTIRLWREALLNYEKSLDIEERRKTRENYEFVKSKLDKLEEDDENKGKKDSELNSEGQNTDRKTKEKKKDSETSSEGEGIEKKTGDKKDSETSSEGQGTNEKNNVIKSNRGEQYKLSKDKKLDTLSKEEESYIKRYTQNLKLEQKNNQQFFNKKSLDTNKDLFDSFFNSSFDSSFDNGGEIDW